MTNELETNLTPLMKQYHQLKAQYMDCLLMFRLGDFYELFGDDAIKASPILGVVLTKRQSVPMCGVPYHSLNNYLAKLIHAGLKVAICEQLEDPKEVKGIVKRDVVRIITPGTVLEDFILEPKKNNYLTSIKIEKTNNEFYFGIASVDISTGDFIVTQFKDINFTKLFNELAKISPSEIVLPQESKEKYHLDQKDFFTNIHFEYLNDYYFDTVLAIEKIKLLYKIKSLESFGIYEQKHSIVLSAIGGILEYLDKTQKNFVTKLKNIHFYSIEDYMYLDTTCIRNLELVESFYTRTKENTLLEIIDQTITSSGGRLLRNWLLKPLLKIEDIVERQNCVELFFEDNFIRTKIREKLKSISDIERIVNKISAKTVNPKELISLSETLKTIPQINQLIKEIIGENRILNTTEFEKLLIIPELNEVAEIIEKSINPDAPVDIKKGNVIKPGYSKELDELKTFATSSKTWLMQYQEELKQKTGISSLKIGFTNVFGYYIEVTNTNLSSVPKEFIRKQTLKNAERFITEELKNFENKILSAEEKILQLENSLYTEILDKLLSYANQLYEINKKLSQLDVYTNFAEIARKYNYTKPNINLSYTIDLKSSRHPVVEQLLPKGKFIPNDFFLDGKDSQVMLITGPNMAGKSTYIRQIALIVILAQIGSFVPAESATIGIVDRIFARIGASDYLAGGLSTFMVEMQETANILNNATERSLIILDEIGRGTSTYDGISIAWACVEYLVDKKNWSNKNFGPKTLFATHYFELTELENKYKEVKNYNVTVKEFNEEIVFLHKIQPGCSDKSYGIHVAKLAGIPKNVISRAKKLLTQLQQKSGKIDETIFSPYQQLNFENNIDDTKEKKFFSQVLEEIKKIDINNITPIESFNKLIQWKRLIDKKDEDHKE
jgi:DNA mismatch repair protein MutS